MTPQSAAAQNDLTASLVKDPLQADQTAYETLGVNFRSQNTDLEAAFRMQLAKRGNVQSLTRAWRLLQNTVERTVLDIFHYVPELDSHLRPSPLAQPSVLEPAAREATGQAWQNQLRAEFPDAGVAHSLAVLWFWWAWWQEDQALAAKGGNNRNALQFFPGKMWEKAIACWAMALNSDEFWERLPNAGKDIATQIANAVINRLAERFREMAQRHRQNGSANFAARYQELELAMTTELRCARLIGGAGIRTGRGKFACGPLMLNQVGLMASVRIQVETALKRTPNNQRLQEARDALSPFARIAVLLQNNNAQAAIEALDVLSKEDQASADGLALRAKALHQLGKQQASLNQCEQALQTWELALKCNPGRELKSAIEQEITASCQTRVASLQQQPEAAIALLERALKLTDDVKLKLLLAELLTNRGVAVINEAQKQLQSDRTSKSGKDAVRRGLDDLERAAKLGSRRATEQVELARNIQEAVNNAGWQEPLAAAGAAAQKQDWSTAIGLLRAALMAAPNNQKAAIRRNLAISLANRANATLVQLTGKSETERLFSNPIDTLVQAEKDLVEANQLESGDEDIQQSLQVVRLLLAQARGDSMPMYTPSASSRYATRHSSNLKEICSNFFSLIGQYFMVWVWVLYLFEGGTASKVAGGVILGIIAIFFFLLAKARAEG